MRSSASVTPAAILFLFVIPMNARALDGTVTGISITPNPAPVNDYVTIVVEGSQKCKKVSVDFGDNSSGYVLDNPAWDDNNDDDNTLVHKYASEGIYTIVASAVEQCSGSAQATLTVGTGGKTMIDMNVVKEYLCAILGNCGEQLMKASEDLDTVKERPSLLESIAILESIFPFSVVKPGGVVIVSGKHFGTTPGELHLFLKTDNKDVALDILEWGDSYVGAKIPILISGVVDQPAEFYVKTAWGSKSNLKGPATFTAKRETRDLMQSEVALVHCGDSDWDRCNDWVSDSDDLNAKVPKGGNAAVWGVHYKNWGELGKDEGFDSYNLPKLKNGWVYYKFPLSVQVDPGQGSAVGKLQVEPTYARAYVYWMVTPADSVRYDGWVWIRGPVGTAHK